MRPAFLRPAFLLILLAGCSKQATIATGHVPVDSSCDFVRTQAHADGLALLREFVDRDADGEFTHASTWFDGAVTCPGHEAAPDEAIEASSHQLTVLSHMSDSIAAEVRWNRLGSVGAGGERESLGLEVDTVVALRTPYGWRVASPALNPHVPPRVPREQSAASSPKPVSNER